MSVTCLWEAVGCFITSLYYVISCSYLVNFAKYDLSRSLAIIACQGRPTGSQRCKTSSKLGLFYIAYLGAFECACSTAVGGTSSSITPSHTYYDTSSSEGYHAITNIS